MPSNMEEFKWELNYQKVIGFGLPFGCCPNTMNMENGLPVVKSTLWKAEAMWTILRNSEEVLKLLDRLCTGVLISSLISTPRPMLKSQLAVVLLLMISIPMESTGMTKKFTHTLMMTQIEFLRSTTHPKATGIGQASPTDPTLGSIQRTRMLPSTESSTW